MRSYEAALEVQHRHESAIMAMPGVTAVGVKLRAGDLVLEVSVDPDAPVPPGLQELDLDDLPLVVEHRPHDAR